MKIDLDIKKFIRTVPDFPKPGINFYDITTILQKPELLRAVIETMGNWYEPENVDVVVGTESRGFILGSPLAVDLEAGFVPVRKKGKLPWRTTRAGYDKEYGRDEIEIHTDAIRPGQKVLVVDDLLATGGTINATKELVEKLGGEIVGFAFLIELFNLKGRELLSDYRVDSLLKYPE
jgi:adenine phosphoribosyltransferase